MDAWLLGAPHAYLDILYLLAVLWVLGQRKHDQRLAVFRSTILGRSARRDNRHVLFAVLAWKVMGTAVEV